MPATEIRLIESLHDYDAEQAIFSRIFCDPESFARIAGQLVPEDFTVEKHRRIWDACLFLQQEGTAIDLVNVAGRLSATGKLASVGGCSGLLAMDNGLGTIFGEQDYVHRLQKKTALRHVRAVGKKLIAESEMGTAAPDLASLGAEKLREISDRVQSTGGKRRPRRAGDILRDAGGVDSFFTKKPAVATMDWPGANKILGGGFRPGNLVILAAETGGGKTTAALQTAYHNASRGRAVHLFSFEMGEDELLDRLCCLHTGVDSNALKQNMLTQDELRMVKQASVHIANMPLFINDYSSSLPDIESEMQMVLEEMPLSLVVIDYLQLVAPVIQYDTRAETVGTISRGLKKLFRKYKVPGLVLSQFNRGTKGGEPELYHLLESGSIEKDCDIAMFIHPKKNQSPYVSHVRGDLLIKKHRNGPIGAIPLDFNKARARFEEPTDAPEPQSTYHPNTSAAYDDDDDN